MESFREEDVISLASKIFKQTLAGAHQVICGIGDDTAVLKALPSECVRLLTTDTIVEGTHFLAGEKAARIAHKAVAVNISDIAAMGGTAEALLLSLTIPPQSSLEYLQEIIVGIGASAKKFDVAVIGGDTVGGQNLSLSITMLGWARADKVCYRSGATAGDLVVVTGKLGGSYSSGKHLDFSPRIKEAKWLMENIKPSAMMDLSDGLGKDLNRMALASNLSLELKSAAIPLNNHCKVKNAIVDGEDFELLFTCKPESINAELKAQFQQLFELDLSVIGQAKLGVAKVLLDNIEIKAEGYEHFEISS